MKYITIDKSSGTGMITHADQDIDGLSFAIEQTHDDGRAVVAIDGPEDKIKAWKNRVKSR